MNEKQISAEYSINYIEDGMLVGLGTGSTVRFMVLKLAERVKQGLRITAVSTSVSTTELAKSLKINVVDFNSVENIDLTIDGADEVDPDLNGIKGGGGALLYEKIVARQSSKNIWIVDSGKKVNKLGKFPLPVEVMPFGSKQLFEKFVEDGFSPKFREQEGKRFVTDGNHYLIDLQLNKIENPYELNTNLHLIPGVVETGLFLDVADIVLVGKGSGCEVIERQKKRSTKKFD
jgi:ribose 5-phosphate isomerase A